MKGKKVLREQALDGCERILKEEFKDVPERAIYMIGEVKTTSLSAAMKVGK